MSTTSKSPRRVLLVAHAVGKDALPAYAHRCSPKKFTQPQLFAALVLKSFLKTDYRGLAALQSDLPDLRAASDLDQVPHFTTFQKAERRLLRSAEAGALLEATIVQAGRAKIMSRRVKLAAIDGTGFESHQVSAYFVKRRQRGQSLWQTTTYTRFPKAGLLCDCASHLLLAVVPGRGPGPDHHHFAKALRQTRGRVTIETLLADAGYDGEASHLLARERYGMRTTIPPKIGRPTAKLPRGRWRRVMATRFNKVKYGQRWQSETVISMIKRLQGSALTARTYWSQCREISLRAITHNVMVLRRITKGFLQSRSGVFFHPFLA